jgi:hypothetical protein
MQKLPAASILVWVANTSLLAFQYPRLLPKMEMGAKVLRVTPALTVKEAVSVAAPADRMTNELIEKKRRTDRALRRMDRP